MGVIQLPDELHQAIEQQVQSGRAESASAFVAEAVRRFVDDGTAEENDLERAAAAGIADIEAGHFTLIDSNAAMDALEGRLLARLRDRLTAEG